MEKDFFAQQPRSYLYFGVTQVLDPSNLPERVAEFAAQPQHPDIYRCGAAPVVDGYPLVFIDKAIRHTIFNDYIFEPANAREHPLPAGANPAEHTPEAVVARIAASGALCVKVFAGRWLRRSHATGRIMSAETLRRVRAATQKHGLLLVGACECAGHAAHRDRRQCRPHRARRLELERARTAARACRRPSRITCASIHDKKIGYQATLRVLPGVTDLLDPRCSTIRCIAKVVPPRLLAWYRTEPAQWFKREVFGPNVDAAAVLAGVRAANERWATSEHGMRALRHLYELGQPMLLGSDTPSAPTYGNQPGYDTYKEMQLMAQAGIPLSAIFAAGTINNARQFGPGQGLRHDRERQDREPAAARGQSAGERGGLDEDRQGDPARRAHRPGNAGRGREVDEERPLWLTGHYSFSAGVSTSTRRLPARSSSPRRPGARRARCGASSAWRASASRTCCGGPSNAAAGSRCRPRRCWSASSPATLLIATVSYLLDDRAVAGGVRHPRRADRRGLLPEADAGRPASQPVHHHPGGPRRLGRRSTWPSPCNAAATTPSCARRNSAKRCRPRSCAC